MIFIKIFLIAVLTAIFIIFAFSSRLKIFQKLSVILGYLTLFFFILFPHYSDKIAQLFSIGTGKDLILYITVSLMSLISIIIYVGMKNNALAITKIVRNDAIKNAKKCK